MGNKSFTRRDFIKYAAAAAVGCIAVPTIATDFWGNPIGKSGSMPFVSDASLASGHQAYNAIPTEGADAKMSHMIAGQDIAVQNPPAAQQEAAAPQQQSASPSSTQTYTDTYYPNWNLALVNRWNPLPQGFTPKLASLEGGYRIDYRCVNEAAAMLAACRAAGAGASICSAYRGYDLQSSLFRNAKNKKMAQGMSEADAYYQTSLSTAIPGTSEHQLGLALDIVDTSNRALNDSQESSGTSRWLHDHCWEYGFILRYPSDKTNITGIIYEPWHYRFVGTEAAIYMRDTGLCLEEYLT